MKKRNLTSLFAALVLTVVAGSSLLCGNAIVSYEDVTGDVRTELAGSSFEEPEIELMDLQSPNILWEKSSFSHHALTVCKATTKMSDTVLRFSSNGVFYHTGSNNVWYADKSEVYLPVNDDGYPFYKYAGIVDAVDKALIDGPYYLVEPFTLTTFSTNVTRSSSQYIPTSYGQESGKAQNTWGHGGNADLLLYTLVYNGEVFDGSISIPWIGYKYQSQTASDGTEFEVRVGPGKVSVKASQDVYLTSVNAFAFRTM